MDTISGLFCGFFMQPKRRSYTKAFKAQIIQDCAQSDASIASVAQCQSRAQMDSRSSQ
jgi:transposase-like protein